jgi:hypothetical protein
MPQRLAKLAVAADACTSGTAMALASSAAQAATVSASRRRAPRQPTGAGWDWDMGERLLA